MLRRRLGTKGYQVIVYGAEEGSQSNQPDLVLMDLHLPILDGWEATRQIKSNPKLSIRLAADAIAETRKSSSGGLR